MGVGGVVVIVQARAGGARFPGKVLAPLLGQPMLLWQLDRLARVKYPHRLVVACPNTDGNEAITDLCARHGYQSWMYPGAEADVLGRYYQAAEEMETAIVVRITGDCPLIDPAVVDMMLTQYMVVNPRLDHLGIGEQSLWPDGQDCEVIAFEALKAAHEEATLPSDREHVTPFLYHQPERFRCATLPCPFDLSMEGYSVDTQDDLAMVSIILGQCLLHYGPTFGWREIHTILQTHNLAQRLHKARAPRNHTYHRQQALEASV